MTQRKPLTLYNGSQALKVEIHYLTIPSGVDPQQFDYPVQRVVLTPPPGDYFCGEQITLSPQAVKKLFWEIHRIEHPPIP